MTDRSAAGRGTRGSGRSGSGSLADPGHNPPAEELLDHLPVTGVMPGDPLHPPAAWRGRYGNRRRNYAPPSKRQLRAGLAFGHPPPITPGKR